MVAGIKNALFGLGVAAVLFASLFFRVADTDLWAHLAFGREFWRTGHLPMQDVFSYLPTKNPWIFHEWLFGVVCFPLQAFWGGTGLQAAKYLLGFGGMMAAFLAARQRGASASACLFCLLCAGFAFCFEFSPLRAQAFSFIFFALVIFIVENVRQSKRMRRLAWVLPIMALWCNLHGGFMAGLAVLFLYALGEALARRDYKPWVAIFAASVAATLINPYGFGLWREVLRHAAHPQPQIVEWFSFFAAWRAGLYRPFLLLFLLMAAFLPALAVTRFKKDPASVLVLGATFLLGLARIHHLSLFYLSFAIYAPEILDSLFNAKPGPPMRRLAQAALRTCLAAILVTNFWLFWSKANANGFRGSPFSLVVPGVEDTQWKDYFYPIGALKFMKANNLGGNILADSSWAGLILWYLYPGCRVAVDGRQETVYPPAVLDGFWTYYSLKPGWTAFLNAYPHDLILTLAPTPRSKALQGLADWRVLYADAGSMLFARRTPISRKV